MTRRYTPTRTAAAQRDQAARIQQRITADGSVIVPPRIAAWLERHAGVTGDRRIGLRGVTPSLMRCSRLCIWPPYTTVPIAERNSLGASLIRDHWRCG